jgi:magnesium-transporting ATPase (P-type)
LLSYIAVNMGKTWATCYFRAVGVVIRIGKHSVAGTVAKYVARKAIKETPVGKELTYFRRIITLVAVLLGMAV